MDKSLLQLLLEQSYSLAYWLYANETERDCSCHPFSTSPWCFKKCVERKVNTTKPKVEDVHRCGSVEDALVILV